MCGIVGFLAKSNVVPFLVSGLRRLEYRGYDSAGIAILGADSALQMTKTAGRIDNLEEKLDNSSKPFTGNNGIGHTRWATHGEPTTRNSHPHLNNDDSIALVHNGVIENYAPLRDELITEGYSFRSETDTEVIVHLLDREMRNAGLLGNQEEPLDAKQLSEVLQSTFAQLRGAFGLAILLRDHPDLLIAARRSSPLLVGKSADEYFIASDASALAGYAEEVVQLSDHEVAIISRESGLHLFHRDAGRIEAQGKALDQEVADLELGDFPHYMLKEIFEQPKSVEAAIRGRLDWDNATTRLGGLRLLPGKLRNTGQFIFSACGTSWHAAQVAEYQIEALSRIPVEVEYASELRYRNPPITRDAIFVAMTQSGETADTLAAMREMQRKGYPVLAINNVVGSTIAEESDGGVYLHAGPEIGVASTKAFTSQCTVTALLAIYLGRLRHLSHEFGEKALNQLQMLPEKISTALECAGEVERIAKKYADCDNFLYLGRQFNFPTALEGALKLKEISYIHAEGCPAAEMKHGPIALIEKNTPSVFIMPQGGVYEKTLANAEEIKARGGPVIAIAEEGDTKTKTVADEVVYVPEISSFLQPILSVVPLQLLAYYIAIERGCDVDKPRNLAKSVTVE